MAGKPLKGYFIPTNPKKYVGNVSDITFRSSWEQSFMLFLDQNPAVLHWNSECIQIPYRNPLNGRWSMYVPDFFMVYIDKQNKQHAEIIEIKPIRETPGYNEKKISKRTQLTQIINQAKWTAAAIYCAKKGIRFRVLTERELFGMKKK